MLIWPAQIFPDEGDLSFLYITGPGRLGRSVSLLQGVNVSTGCIKIGENLVDKSGSGVVMHIDAFMHDIMRGGKKPYSDVYFHRDVYASPIGPKAYELAKSRSIRKSPWTRRPSSR